MPEELWHGIIHNAREIGPGPYVGCAVHTDFEWGCEDVNCVHSTPYS